MPRRGRRKEATIVVEGSFEEYQAQYGSDERYCAHLARRVIRSELGARREIWVLVYGAMEPHAALFAGERARPRSRKFRTRQAAEVWASRLLGITPDRWVERDEPPGSVH